MKISTPPYIKCLIAHFITNFLQLCFIWTITTCPTSIMKYETSLESPCYDNYIIQGTIWPQNKLAVRMPINGCNDSGLCPVWVQKSTTNSKSAHGVECLHEVVLSFLCLWFRSSRWTTVSFTARIIGATSLKMRDREGERERGETIMYSICV